MEKGDTVIFTPCANKIPWFFTNFWKYEIIANPCNIFIPNVNLFFLQLRRTLKSIIPHLHIDLLFSISITLINPTSYNVPCYIFLHFYCARDIYIFIFLLSLRVFAYKMKMKHVSSIRRWICLLVHSSCSIWISLQLSRLNVFSLWLQVLENRGGFQPDRSTIQSWIYHNGDVVEEALLRQHEHQVVHWPIETH